VIAPCEKIVERADFAETVVELPDAVAWLTAHFQIKMRFFFVVSLFYFFQYSDFMQRFIKECLSVSF
jgi:hypothetical protein